MEVDDTIAGLEKLKAKIKVASEDASAKGADVVVKWTRQTSPKRTHALEYSIRRTKPKEENGEWITDVSPHRIYARVQEMGGVIVPRDHTMLSWENDGRRYFARKVHLVGQHYFSRGYERAIPEVRKVVVNTIGDAIGD